MTLPQQSSQQQSQHFLLKWNNHRSNMVNVFESLLQSENLVDVTIAVEGKFLKAHKIVLSACSPYFQAMFVSHTPSEKYPILVFHDMKFAHLKTLLDFMYRGEISIDEKDLGEVLKVAEALSIRGLSSFESDDEESEKSEPCQSQNQNNNNNNNNSNNSSNNSNNTENHSVANENPSTNTTSTTTAASTTPTPRGDKSSSSGGSGSSHFSKANGKSKSSSTNHAKFVSSSSSSSSSGATGGSNDNHNTATSSSSQNNGCDSSVSSNCNDKSSGSSGGIKASKFFNPERPNSSQATAEPKPLINTPLPVKKKRGRQPKKGLLPVDLPLPPVQTTLKTPSSSSKELQARFPELKTPVPRQGVRRRLPRRFPGVPTRLKRVKLSKRDEDEMFVAGNEGILTDLADGPDCEPLSEMSVRGLDLFKYASIEDGVYRCIECEKLRIPKTFKNKYSFQRHAFLYHEGNMRKVFPCPVCSREFSRPDKMKNHLRSIHEGRNSRVSNNSGDVDENPENNVIMTKSEGNESCDV